MQVNCPNCGAKVSAENINIQKMTAVCGACDTVFSFDLPETAIKAKRRKVKQPAKITLNDSDMLHMEFWTNFRLDRNQAFISGTVGAGGMMFLALLFIISKGVPIILPLVFALIASVLFYQLALTVVNKTHIDIDDDVVKVTRKPFPNPLNQGHEVSLAGVTAIKYEETAISKKEAYDTPRYIVWAQTEEGSRRTIITDVTEDYAVFIAQKLEEHLQTAGDFDVSRLANDEHDELMDEPLHTSQNKLRQ